MNTTIIISALITVGFLCGLALVCASREDKRIGEIQRRLNELEGKKEAEVK